MTTLTLIALALLAIALTHRSANSKAATLGAAILHDIFYHHLEVAKHKHHFQERVLKKAGYSASDLTAAIAFDRSIRALIAIGLIESVRHGDGILAIEVDAREPTQHRAHTFLKLTPKGLLMCNELAILEAVEALDADQAPITAAAIREVLANRSVPFSPELLHILIRKLVENNHLEHFGDYTFGPTSEGIRHLNKLKAEAFSTFEKAA